MGGGTPARILLEPPRGHLARLWRLVRFAVGLGALLGISVSALAVSGRASATLGSPVTTAFFDSEPGEPLLHGGSLTFPSMVYQGGGSSPRFSIFGADGSAWQIYFAAPTSQAGGLVPGVYEDAQYNADATHPELAIYGGAVNSCTYGTGRFIVDDITVSGGVLQTFSARFEEHDCNGDPALFGAISYNSTADYRTRTISPTSLSLSTTGKIPTSGNVTITDNGPSTLTPSGFNISGADAAEFVITGNTCTSPLAATDACTVTITYTPGFTPSQASATLSYYDELSPQGSAGEPVTSGTGRDIPLTGTDTPPLVASTSNLDFGEATLGTFVSDTFVLTNAGNSTDTIDLSTNDLTFSGPGADDYVVTPAPGCPGDGVSTVILASGANCTMDVSFFPGALGDRSATMAIKGLDNTTLSMSLSGTGTTGYYQVDSSGQVAHMGDAAYYGDAGSMTLNKPIVGMAATGDDGGYWLVASDGGIFDYGDANFYGSTGSIHLNKPIVGMAGTLDAGGYWLVATDGGIFSYGDAPFYGSTGSIHLNKPIVGMAPTPDGKGYWLVASDGGIFSYGDAQFFGSTGSIHLNKPIVGMAPTPDGRGYWLVASDGGIFSYGDAQFFGSTGAIHLAQPIVAMAAMPTGGGYWFSAADGGLFNYGDAPFLGSGVGIGLGTVVDMTSDGGPTVQAYLDAPAIRQAHLSDPGTIALRKVPRFAGP